MIHGDEINQIKSNQIKSNQGNVDLYIHSPIHLHGILLNSLSTGTTLPYLLPTIVKMKYGDDSVTEYEQVISHPG
jgi:hypothetical protein